MTRYAPRQLTSSDVPVQASQLVISAPYPEAAVRAIAAAAVNRDANTLLFASGGLPQWVIDRAVTQRLISPDMGRRLARRARFSSSAVELARAPELMRLLTRLVGSPRVHHWWMYRSAELFDRAVARRLKQVDAGAVLAMPGAAEVTFERASARGARRVFHAVNAHPQVHNERLRDAYGGRARMEMLTGSMVERVTRELSLATTVLVPSRLVAEQMTSHGVDPRMVIRVPYGAPPPAHDAAPLRGVADRRRPRALFVGQIGYRKGVPFLLDAVRGRPIDVQLVGPTVASEVLDGLPFNVEHLGSVSNDAVVRLMAEADVFVLPTVEDACALVVAEAAMQGLPVITTDQNGAAELLDERDLRTVPSADVAALREALCAVTVLSSQDRIARRHRLASSGGILTWAEYGAEVLTRCELIDGRARGVTT